MIIGALIKTFNKNVAGGQFVERMAVEQWNRNNYTINIEVVIMKVIENSL